MNWFELSFRSVLSHLTDEISHFKCCILKVENHGTIPNKIVFFSTDPKRILTQIGQQSQNSGRQRWRKPVYCHQPFLCLFKIWNRSTKPFLQRILYAWLMLKYQHMLTSVTCMPNTIRDNILLLWLALFLVLCNNCVKVTLVGVSWNMIWSLNVQGVLRKILWALRTLKTFWRDLDVTSGDLQFHLVLHKLFHFEEILLRLLVAQTFLRIWKSI